jgi:signal transduction histidine kinase
MSLRLLAGLLAAAAIVMAPFANLLLSRWFPPPDITFQLRLCGADEQPSRERPCLREGIRAQALRGHAGEDSIIERRVRLPPGAIAFATPAASMMPLHEIREGFGGPFRPYDFDGIRNVRTHFMWINLVSLVLVVVTAMLLATLLLRRPFRALLSAIDDIERGAAPPAWAFSGPTELRTIGQALTRLGRQLRGNLQERELMLAGLSHDLRSPLARIQAKLELRSADGENWNDTLHDVQEINHIVGQCIDYVRDGQDEAAIPVSLDELARRTLQGSREGVELQLQAPEALPLRVQSLLRAIRNLLDNAATHGEAPVRLVTEQTAVHALLRVEDGGAGIDPAHWERLLKPFARGSVARSSGGAGLGLAIVQRVADLHGAELRMLPRSATQPFAIELRFPR